MTATESLWDDYVTISPSRDEKNPFYDVQEEVSEEEKGNSTNWDSYNEIKQDSGIKSLFRYLYQPVSGYLSMTPYGVLSSLWQGWGTGEALSEFDELEERLPELKEKFKGFGIEIPEKLDRDKYMEAVNEAASLVPSITNLESAIEGSTGLPLEAQTRFQRLLRLSGQGGKITPGDISQKVLGGVVAATGSRGLESLGVPEEFADILSLLGLGIGGEKIPSAQKGVKNIRNRTMPPQLEEKALQSIEGSRDVSTPGGSSQLPLSTYETSEEILQALGDKETAEISKLLGSEPKEKLSGIRPQPQTVSKNELTGRVKISDEELGIKPTPQVSSRDVSPDAIRNKIGNDIYRGTVDNPVNAGRVTKNLILEENQRQYNIVNDLYKESRELNQEITSIQPELIESLRERIAEINRIPSPGTVSTRLRAEMNRILRRLSTTNEEGHITGYRPIENQILIDQVQELRQLVDYDFAQGGAKQKIKPVIRDLQRAAIQTAERTGNVDAANALLDAQEAYANWSRTFDNSYINPYRDLSNRDYSNLYKRLGNVDNYNVMSDILGNSDSGRRILGSAKRDIVDKEISKYAKNPRNINSLDFENSINELSSVLNPGEIKSIRDNFNQFRTNFPKQVRKIQKPSDVSKEVKAIQKYTNKSPEDIEKAFKSRSGIRELKQDLSKTDRGLEIFKKRSQQEVRDILRGGKVKQEYTGSDIYKVMNEKKNFELISELTSPQEAQALLDASKEISDRIFTKENLKNLSKNVAQKAIKYKIFRIFVP